jgi:protein ImuB
MLACWAGAYTPRVTLADGVLRAEIAGSVRLFGGLPTLLGLIRNDLAAMQLSPHLAVAPTPRAAWWLARTADDIVCTDAEQVEQALSAVPLARLPLAAPLARRLGGFGLRRLGDAMALPTAALGHRVGKDFMLDLARARGEIEELLPWFEFPETFDRLLELPAPVDAAPVLQFAARRLIVAVSGWLNARNAAVREIIWQIEHDDHAEATILPLRFSAPVHAVARIERVLKEALERLPLRAPALALGIRVMTTELRDARSALLFDGAASERDKDKLAELLDRLAARLGQEAVQGLAVSADYRPERSTAIVELGNGSAGWRVDAGGMECPERGMAPAQMLDPLWRLERPKPVAERNGRPWLNGPLTLLAGPQRIESGWWDGHDARRDYFIALDSKQRWVWLYRTCKEPFGWFWHGCYG